MNTLIMDDPIQQVAGRELLLAMPSGLLGFEQYKKFVLLSRNGEEPFQWLQALEEPAVAFLVVSPFEILPSYEPQIPDEDVEFLGLRSPEDALLLNIVTLRANGRSTVNLKGPIVVHHDTLLAKQVVLANAAQFSVQHPLPTLE